MTTGHSSTARQNWGGVIEEEWGFSPGGDGHKSPTKALAHTHAHTFIHGEGMREPEAD